MDQPSIKTVTIGATINLDNYESLRVEVVGEVVNPQDADGIVSYLDGMLARFGRADPRTGAKIDKYRERVLSLPDTGVPQKTLEITAQDVAPTVQNTEHIESVGYGVSSGTVCAQCGAEVSKSQAKLAQTLSGRNLCTKCFDDYMKMRRGGSK
jgi:hypothetical protein